MLLVERANHLVGIQNFIALHKLNVSRRDLAFLVHAERQLARFMLDGFEFHALQIQHDIGNVFNDTWQSGELMLGAGDFHRCNGCAFE